MESKGQKILNDDYYMVSTDDTKMYRQSNDTLYLYHCGPDFVPRFDVISRHYKIISSKANAKIKLLKLERLDKIPMTAESVQQNRFFVLAIKELNRKTGGQLMLFQNITKAELDTLSLPLESLSDKFYSTLVSNTYKNELSTLKDISEKQDIDILNGEMKSDKYKEMFKIYQSTKLNDMYGSIINAELFYRSLLAKGYNPIGSGPKFNELQRKPK